MQHSDLLNQKVTADTTFTAVTTSTQNTVTAMWWETESNSIKQQFSKNVDWNNPVAATSRRTAPSTTVQAITSSAGASTDRCHQAARRDYQCACHRRGELHRQYTEKADITVTLNANGGAFADGKVIVEMSDQKYGGRSGL